jgi:AraC-like DNA-binding protein
MQASIVLDSRDFPPAQRAMAFRDVAATMCLLDVSPRADTPFGSRMQLYQLPSMQLSRTTWTASTTVRTRPHAYATGDHVIAHIPLRGQFTMQQSGGAAVTCRPGMVYLDPTAEAGKDVFDAPRNDLLYLSVPRTALTAQRPEVGDQLRRAHALNAPWRLLLSYAQALTAEHDVLQAAELAQIERHLLELLHMALDASQGAGKRVSRHASPAFRAARLATVKHFIDAHLSDPQLSPGFVARHLKMPDRSIRALFADEGGSCRDYILSRRLERVHQRLASTDEAATRISDVALAQGFGDLSWFNHCFKRHFGCAPSDVRAGTRTTPDTNP